ncbi:hypothetical protein AVEN_18587-1 [Araneus ventricosus]|uniref:DDE Tnp4 domain-containing protein n=1 Tax=Araneus ventricosus TaxID=182803 RepID=A0A4Y2FPJ1_ARAVE|nr:hypothetical protein AVEN_18587-1 [Araneus ventricosus]
MVWCTYSAIGLYHPLVAYCEQLKGVANVGVITAEEGISLIVWAVKTRILRNPLLIQPENTVKVMLTCVHLHNSVCKSQSSVHHIEPHRHSTLTTQQRKHWYLSVKDGRNAHGNNIEIKRVPRKPSILAKQMRGELSGYFTSAGGSVSWQNGYC